ncbi:MULTISPECIES: nucleotidyltransferase family protein [Empedobacter]|uniref:nucleotidyltransferase family protein n=1 Tax=Empedobacter TaxID=59734 RepID=UPI001C565E4A|nr:MULTISPECIES: nucleotidyltransferase family protein [Empedobacter]MBW1618868.1 nucleotidyltransferase family protein [Empedobacter falsenii]MBY0066340.1 nucleotidyltransferase family protein [Empedobacter falsenii]MDH0658117.1 nucleotidyltransferase family protein [Empedobacter sp. GD03865]MDH0675480.1 nucleotidyltransferase family protein [Empedobacter sp. GD03861]MDM1139071.1 nucleotidyltransferase family protein [Empedobacter sp. R132-2]
MKAMIFAAGLGTRLKPFTDNHPKALAVVNGKPLLQRNIEYLKSFGINEIVINVHHFADQIIEFLEDNNYFGIEITISDETDQVLETGGGLVKAKANFEEDFLVMNVDILTDLNLAKFIKAHQENKALVTLAVSDRNSSRKLFFNEQNELKGWRNLKTEEEIKAVDSLDNCKDLAFSGIHVISPTLFDKITEKGKFSIMKVYMDLMKTESIIGFDHSGGILIDVGRPESVLEAEQYFK